MRSVFNRNLEARVLIQAFHYMSCGALQQKESIHANGEVEEVKEKQKEIEKHPTMQQVLLQDPDFTLDKDINSIQ